MKTTVKKWASFALQFEFILMLTSGQTGQKTGSKQTLLFMTRGRQVGREGGRQTGRLERKADRLGRLMD